MEEKVDVLNELGEFTGKVATREECHQKGLWYRAVYAFIIDKKGNVLLQKRSANKKENIIDKHYNECYLITKEIDIAEIDLQKEEVSKVKYFTKREILERINNNYEGLTEKTGPWNFLERILNNYVL